MDIEIDKDRVITKFKRNGHYLNKNGLEMVVEHLHEVADPNKKLDEIIKKINEMVIMDQQQFNEKTLKLGLELLSHRSETGKTFNSYQKLINHISRWTIFYLSPYENKQRFFADRPVPGSFDFQAANFCEINLKRFKQIKEFNKICSTQGTQHTFIGVVYESYSSKGSRIMLQNQVNEIQLVLPPKFTADCFLISGCTYIAKGSFKTGDLQLTVSEIKLPTPLPLKKNTLCKQKLKLVCDNLLGTKNLLDFSVQDMKRYQMIYNKEENKGKPILMFGNVCITRVDIQRIKSIVKKYPYGIQCLILMISSQGHENFDLKKQFESTPVFIVPHLDSEGPRILPKIPILKNDYNVKIVTNPARFSIHGKECIFLNYPLVHNLYSKSLVGKQIENVDTDEMVKKVSRMLFSQNNVALCNKIYWKQSEYFNISADDLIFVCDKSCPQNFYFENQNKFISLGNFQRDGDFVAFMPEIKDSIQLCEEPQ